MSIFAVVLAAATLTSAPVPGSGVLVTTVKANNWVGVHVSVVGWAKNEVDVEAQTPNPNVRARIDRTGNVTRVTAVYTGPHNTAFFGLFHWGDHKGVKWIVHVPATKTVTVRSVNAGVSVDGVRGAVDVGTDNGGVSVDHAGPDVRVRTDNGGVSVNVASLEGKPVAIDVHTDNGGVNVRVPKGTRARVETATSNGAVSNALGNGSGPGTITVKTSNGGIGISAG